MSQLPEAPYERSMDLHDLLNVIVLYQATFDESTPVGKQGRDREVDGDNHVRKRQTIHREGEDSGPIGLIDQASYLVLYHIGQMADPRLGRIKASRWTYVTADDRLL